MKVFKINVKQFIGRPVEEVFGFFSRPENLSVITPSNLNFKILTPTPLEMKQGAVIDYTIKIFKVPIHWRTFITTYDPPFKFVDEQIKGPYNFWHHTHMFKEVPEGVEIFDEVHYSIPFGPLGSMGARASGSKEEEGAEEGEAEAPGAAAPGMRSMSAAAAW